MMICGTLTLRYLFRIVLSGAVAKGEDFITSGSVTRQGGYYEASSVNYTLTYPISFPHSALSISVLTDSFMRSGNANYPVIGGAFSKSSVRINNNTYENRYIVIGYYTGWI